MSFEADLGKVNASYFFREFTFSRNKFKPNRRTELELADDLIWLDDFLIIIQVKERYASFNATAQDEENWFRNEVLGKACSQIENSLAYLNTYDSIDLENNQGHGFNLANANDKYPHKLVVFHPDKPLPDELASKKFHISSTAGVIHLIRSMEYFGILQTLITPAEVTDYLAFREALITSGEMLFHTSPRRRSWVNTCEIRQK